MKELIKKLKSRMMKKLTYFLLSAIFVFMAAGCEKEENQPFSYTEYTGYSVMGSYQMEDHQSFLLIEDMSDFDAIFYPKTTQAAQALIHQDDFEKKVAFAVIKEFNNVCDCPEITINSIERINETIVFKYALTGIEPPGEPTCTMNCTLNLVITTDRNSFKSIEIYENDILTKTINK